MRHAHGVHGAGGLHRTTGCRDHLTALGRDFDYVFVAGLVRHAVEVAIGVDHQARATSVGGRIQVHDRGREVGDVQATPQVFRDLGIVDVDDHARAFAAHVGIGAVAAEAQDYPAGAIVAATEIDLGDLQVAGDVLAGIGPVDHGAAGARLGDDIAGVHGHHQLVAGAARGVSGWPEQVDHDAGSTARFRRRNRRSGAAADGHASGTQAVAGVRQIDGDPGRAVGGEGLHLTDRARELQGDVHLAAGCGGITDVLQDVAGQGGGADQ